MARIDKETSREAKELLAPGRWSVFLESLLAFLSPARTDHPKTITPRNSSWWPI
jgi:hypothetical protein